MKFKKLLTAISVLFIIAGCSEVDQTDEIQPAAAEEQKTILSEADTTAFQGAVELKDETFCDKITDNKYKEECKMTILDQKYSEEAQNKMDESLCDKISGKDIKEACKINVEVLKKKEQNKAALKEDESLMNEIIQSGDISRCKEVKDENFIVGCEANILSNKAIAAEDLTICEQATSDKAKENCKENAKLSIEPATSQD